MSMQYIRDTYKVPAKRGARVVYTGNGNREYGTILGTSGARLRIQMDGDPGPRTFHPTWEMQYLPPSEIELLTT